MATSDWRKLGRTATRALGCFRAERVDKSVSGGGGARNTQAELEVGPGQNFVTRPLGCNWRQWRETRGGRELDKESRSPAECHGLGWPLGIRTRSFALPFALSAIYNK